MNHQQAYFHIDVYSHGIKISRPLPIMIGYLFAFIQKYKVKGFATESRGKVSPAPYRYFGIASYSSSVFHFHIEQLEPLLFWLKSKGIDESRYYMVQHAVPTPVKVDLRSTKDKSPRGQQMDAIDFIINPREVSNHSRLLTMPTGTGKTYTALYAACEIGLRTAVVINPTYVGKWVSDIVTNTNVTEDEIFTIQGGDSLRTLMVKAMNGGIDHIKFFVISIKTMESYYADYEKADGIMDHITFDIAPNDLYPALGIGTVIYDEVHQMLSMVYKSIVYTHTQLVIGLSATMISLNEDVMCIQRLLFPAEIRFNEIIMRRYISCIAIGYEYEGLQQLKLKSGFHGSTTYSHVAFEESLMLKTYAFKQYLDMLGYILYHLYKGGDTNYKPGDKAIIFSATISMCTKLAEFFKTKYPELDVRRYVGADPYENITDPDIVITTLQSGGTGIDIPNLTFALNTVSVQSAVANLQVLGRLREIPDREVKFSYLYCPQIPKQLSYHLDKRQLFVTKVKSIKDVVIPFKLANKPFR